ncbi:protein FAM47E-like isoform X1 [Hoplias malabaricus]|uniref:protein FAM47E-like isoform X1 n=1 Tax=Hoplias malabaricus TaxID=27720 RepID=UPI00346206F6
MTGTKSSEMSDRMCPTVLRECAPQHPWYKERLRTKSLKQPLRKQQLCGAVDGRAWRFLPPGQDDFRDGLPALRSGVLTESQQGVTPPILGLENRARPVTGLKKRFSKDQVCFTKLNSLRQTRRQFVEAVEHRLSAHPLVLYPHLISGLPPQLFNDVLYVLDPEMHVKKESDVICFAKEEDRNENNVATFEGPTQESLMEKKKESSLSNISLKEEVNGLSSRNPYKWQEVKKTCAKEDQMVGEKYWHSPSQDEDIKKVTKPFCDWVASLGGDTSNFTESTVLSLFFNVHEKKPILTLPVQAREAKQIPEELCTTVECTGKEHSSSAQVCSPSINHETLYLDSKKWKRHIVNKKLRDPSIPGDVELEQQPTEKDKELKHTHGTLAFRHFIISEGLRMPRFLSSLLVEEEQKNRTRGADKTATSSSRKGTGKL